MMWVSACCTSLMVALAMDSKQYVVHQVHAGRTSHLSANRQVAMHVGEEIVPVGVYDCGRCSGGSVSRTPCIPCLSYIPFLCDRPSTYDACTNRKCDP